MRIRLARRIASMATTVPRSEKGIGSKCAIRGKCKMFTRIQKEKRKI
jgi:hypothetical protein